MAAAFVRTVFAGTIAAAALPSLLLTINAFSYGWRASGALPVYVQIGMVVAVALGLVTIGTIFVGIPIRMALRRLAMESAGSYVATGALGGVGYLWAILTLIESSLAMELIVIAASSGAATGYVWGRSRPDSRAAAALRSYEGYQPRASRRRVSPPDVRVRSWPTPAVPVGDIQVPPLAFVTALVVIGMTIIVAMAADGRLDWLPRQDYFPPSYRNTYVQCDAERYPDQAGRTLMVDDVEAEWYPQHWRAAQEPSLYLASRSAAARDALTYRFTWLRSFHAPVIVRLDETSDGGMRLRAKQLSGHGGYSPGKPLKVLDRQLTIAEVAEVRRVVAASHLFEQPQIGCLEGVDGSNWLIEANDNGHYRYLKRWTPERGPVREAGLMFLRLTGWTFDDVY